MLFLFKMSLSIFCSAHLSTTQSVEMKRLTVRSAVYLAVDLALAIVCILHISSLRNLARVPFVVEESDGRVIVTEILHPPSCPDLRIGDELLSMLDHNVTAAGVEEFLARHYSVNESVRVEYRR